MEEPEACLVTTPLICKEMSRHDLAEADKVFAGNDLLNQIYETEDQYPVISIDPIDERAIATLIEQDCLRDDVLYETFNVSKNVLRPVTTTSENEKHPKNRRPTHDEICDIAEEAVDRTHPHHADIVQVIEDVFKCAPLIETTKIEVAILHKDTKYRITLHTEFRTDMRCERIIEENHRPRWKFEWIDTFAPRGIQITMKANQTLDVDKKCMTRRGGGIYTNINEIDRIASSPLHTGGNPRPPLDIENYVSTSVKDPAHRRAIVDVINAVMIFGGGAALNSIVVKTYRVASPFFKVILMITDSRYIPSAQHKQEITNTFASMYDIKWQEPSSRHTAYVNDLIVGFTIEMKTPSVVQSLFNHRAAVESVLPFPVSTCITSMIDALIGKETPCDISIGTINDEEKTPHHYNVCIGIEDDEFIVSVARMNDVIQKYREKLRLDIGIGVRRSKPVLNIDVVYLKKVDVLTRDDLCELIRVATATSCVDTSRDQLFTQIIDAVIDPSKVTLYAASVKEIAQDRYCIALDLDDTLPIIPDSECAILCRLNQKCAISFRHEYMQNAPIRRVYVDIYCRSYITRRVDYNDLL